MCKTILLLCYNFFRFLWGKLFYGRRYDVHPIQRISPFCAVRLFGRGQLQIGRNTELAHGCDLEVHGNGRLFIGEGTYMNRYCMVSAHEDVHIGHHCMFGPGVRVFDNDHCFDGDKGVKSELKTAPIYIGDRCWIASNVVILRGTNIGNNCIIGAGCVVKGDIPDGTLVKCIQNKEIQKIG